MPLFICDACGSVDNTATTQYWTCKMEGKALLCSACDPEIGKWHNLFPREQWDGRRIVKNPPVEVSE